MTLRLLLTCEHARSAVPDGVELGVEPAHLATHVAYDRGALAIARGLAEATGAPLHEGAYSRLVVDLNRMADNPEVIAAVTSGLAVPGNAALDAPARAARIARWHTPWREAVRAEAIALSARGYCLHLSIHSFDPAVDPPRRGFDAGVLFDPARVPERAQAAALRDALVSAGFAARLNEPFHGTPEGTTSWLRAQLPPHGYGGVELEASYAWVDDPSRTASYVAAIARAVAAIRA
ncbi:MAG: N-formylglutamate amidohydrolase [Sandaracinaceae bacterium]|nr:N-formylglutamate amidohydrolase [Sandaracinaceae bacterium]